MAAADQDSSSAVPPSMRRQMSDSGGHKLSESNSFSTAPAASPSTASSSGQAGELDDRRSSSSSTSSYGSFYQIDSSSTSSSSFHDFGDPSTEAPPVQAMTAQPAGYDPKRLPSSMFRTQWSATSNESLFSIQLDRLPSGAAEAGAVYGDLYYDTAGVFHRLSSAGRDPAWKLSAAAEAEAPPGVPSGGLCVKDDCARCGSMTRKPVRFANAAGSAKHVPTLPAAMEEEPEEPAPAAEGWSLFGGWCCPSMRWPSCACWGCDTCRC
ncbi:uncharacterized protein DDB_G0271670 [Brachypodium distachyon]|uniref:Uncharacterized protein n=1 Tax=Brachypodium distachyon TaxID=15368 RepID=A0A2K2DBI9_BRADI|nr:uncharacterized protein DDB_G0271670 [Brachypodium distachyon]PNT71647.1 hypothetical protein BRADI_2g33191v3 [Brachypodium distachyon]|eukprot:XP_003566452.1 uncharacterized protein DDB_G0271670 [Brachypodium distachyon]